MKKRLIPQLLVSTLMASCKGAGASKWDAKTAFGDKELNYCLLIGQIDNNDSAARTAGIRDALKTRGNKNTNPNTENPVQGKLTLNGTEYTVNEIEHSEQKATGGATWDQQTATSTTEGWFNKNGSKIDFIVSNNDGMAEGAIAASNYIDGTPIFGYDSNASTLDLIKQGKIMGTVNQDPSAQVAGIFMLARNIMDGVSNPLEDGFTKDSANGYGKIPSTFVYHNDDKSLLVNNFAITSSNIDKYVGKTTADLVYSDVKKGTTGEKNVMFSTYSQSDTFLNSNVNPLVNKYKTTFNFELDATAVGDGNDDKSVLDKMLKTFDAYILNTVKTTSAKSYLDKIYTLEGGSGKISKPVIFYNRQPTDQNGKVDKTVMTDSRFSNIYYVGFDANQGGQVQGQMIVDYLTAQEKLSK